MRASLTGTRVLIVDDNPINLHLIRKLIMKWGGAADVASDGQQAVEQVKTGSDAGAPYDLVLMDLHMPVMDGATACRMIRQFNSVVVILAASADTLPDAEVTTHGFTDFVLKPFDAVQLQDKLLAHIA